MAGKYLLEQLFYCFFVQRVSTKVVLRLDIDPNSDPVLKNLTKNTPIWYQKTLDWDFTTKASYHEWKDSYAIWWWDYVYYIGVETVDIWKKSWSIGYGSMEHPFYVGPGGLYGNVRIMSRWYAYDYGIWQTGWTIWTDMEFNIIAWA
jgi:hypothetical protein